MDHIKVKVCGMRNPDNIQEIASLQPDFMGFIFYKDSKRYVGENVVAESLLTPPGIDRVGVFVNATENDIVSCARKYGFEYVQLHGEESPDFCACIRAQGLKIIKAFSVHEEFDFKSLAPYVYACDYFLFDTKGVNYGGNGVSFDWDILQKYNNALPVFLSGGISTDDISRILNIKELNLFAVDINSKFETAPGLKDEKLVKKFIIDIRKEIKTV